MENPNVDISFKVHQLKEALRDLKDEDVKLQNSFYLNHWLRTHEFDVHKTEQAIRASVKWRQENNITDALIHEDLDPEIADRFPMFFDLKTKQGAPFVYVHIGAMDIGDLMERVGKDRLVRHVAHICMKMEKIVFDWDNQWKGSLEDLPADRTHGFFGVYDADGYSVRQATSIQGEFIGILDQRYYHLTFYLEWTKVCLYYFPSVVRRSRVINASRLVDVPYNLVKSFIASNDYDLALVGSGENELKEHVFNKIQPTILEECKERSKALKEKVEDDNRY